MSDPAYPGIGEDIEPYLAEMSRYAVRIVIYEERIRKGRHVDKNEYLLAYENYRTARSGLSEFARSSGRDTRPFRPSHYTGVSIFERERNAPNEIQW